MNIAYKLKSDCVVFVFHSLFSCFNANSDLEHDVKFWIELTARAYCTIICFEWPSKSVYSISRDNTNDGGSCNYAYFKGNVSS